MGKQKGIFEMWFKNFFFTVFMQSFHALFFMFILRLVSGIYRGTAVANSAGFFEVLWDEATANQDGIVGIIVVIAVLMLTKMEKFFKETFGVGSPSFMGGIGAEAMKGFGTLMHGASLAKRTAEPFKRQAEIQGKMRQNQAKIDKMETRLGIKPTSTDLMNQAKEAKNAGDMDKYQQLRDEAAERRRAEKEAGLNNQLPGANGAQNAQGTAVAANTNNGGNNNQQQNWKMMDDLEDLYAEQNALETEARGLPLKALARMGSTIASVGFGAGAAEDLNATIQVANMVDMPLDALSDKLSDRHANVQQHAINKERAYNASQAGNARMAEIHEKNAKSNEVSLDKSALKDMKNIWKEGTRDLRSNIGNSQRVTGKDGTTVKINNTISNMVAPKSQIKKINKLYEGKADVNNL